MDLLLNSPTERIERAVHWISCETTIGNFTILNGHAPTVLLLQPHSILVMGFADGRQETFLASGGVMEVTRTAIRVLLA